MSNSLRLLAMSAVFAMTGAVFAATPPADAATPAAAGSMKARTPQQQRMADCNKQAIGKKGSERKTFMSGCLKGKTAAAAPLAAHAPNQQNRMKSCNADAKAKSLKGTDRKAFMSSCLKGTAAAAATTRH